jgi:ubiquinol-cytochrome c reductase cytochrome c1 subunit
MFGRALKYAIGGTVTAVGVSEYVSASSSAVHPVQNPWPHLEQLTSTLDNSSVRRGFMVYKQVCSACHSMQYFKWRHIVNVAFTEAETKEMASEFEILKDTPNEEGGYDMRPRGLVDGYPAPYENEILARLANNGANPPDLSLILYARTDEMACKKGEDYIFNLLTGFMDPPAGVTMAEGMNYNPYFGGNAIGMAAPLYNEIIQYDDGTPATMSQLAADVVQFLAWSCEKHRDERKQKFSSAAIYCGVIFVLSVLLKRNDWAGLKSVQYGHRALKKPAHGMYTGKPKMN